MNLAEPSEVRESHLTRAWVARQPIIDRRGGTFAYEIMLRSRPSSIGPDADTSAVALLTAFSEVGIDEICGVDTKALFRIDPGVFHSEALDALPKHRVILGLDPRAFSEARDHIRLAALTRAGFRFAVAAEDSSADPLLRDAELATLDMSSSGVDFARRADAVLRTGARLIARRVETHEEQRRAMDVGCHFMQGLFFQVPEMVSGTHIPTDRAAVLALLAKAQREDTSLAELERLVSGDATLSYRLLRLFRMARFHTVQRVDSVKRAIVMLGRRPLSKWLSLLALAGIDDRPSALLEQSIVRARMCEILGKKFPAHPPAAFFTVGLLSSLDAMLSRPLPIVLAQVDLDPALEAALIERKGILGQVLSAVIDYESGEWRSLDMSAVDPAQLGDAYFDAARYGVEVMAELGRRGR